ncbi:Conserved putative membrane protein [Criblamydia sequanensis CRIB-18]|uniref:Conserved putative membrane protein n=2 Tax=Candidatus Criblamydia sequanensis TaxID=340071 RepID=A0A090CY47_9BACT|nr:DUF378 domain-containing protein [Criblamydia sequanensis]CDR33272.1 Conserved putative membrane protein [Criblamydia sequanensis CRIB-18]
MKYVDLIAAVLLIIGGLNWGLVGLFDFNLVSFLFHSFPEVVRVVYVLVGLAGLWGLWKLFSCNKCCT